MHGPARAGFTLIELAIFAAVLAIVALLVVPQFGNDNASRLRGAAQLVVADLEFARVASMTDMTDPRIVVFDTAAESYYIAATSTPDMPMTNPTGNVPYRVTFGQGWAVHLAGVDLAGVSMGGDAKLSFGQYGQLDQAVDATITLVAGSHSIVITVDPTTGEPNVGDMN